MKGLSQLDWHPGLLDPSTLRKPKPRTSGQTMVIDKGMGLYAFEDLLESSGAYIDMIKIGFGTSSLYPRHVLQRKIELAKQYDICIYPGGTFLEVAVVQGAVEPYFEMIGQLGYNGLEVSDGTIEMERSLRNQLIARAKQRNFTIITEYGKKLSGSTIELEQCAECIEIDIEAGASLVIIEARESGVDVGIFDEHGVCRDQQTAHALSCHPYRDHLMWEAPLKSQQVQLMGLLGADINIGNVAAGDVMSLEALRRGLRSDTFYLGQKGVEMKVQP